MSITITSADPTLPALTVDPARRTRAVRWPLFGVAAGVAGLGAGLFSISSGISEEDAQRGVGVIDQLERGNFYVSFVLGLISVAALLVTVSGWRRWAEDRAPRDLAARTISNGMAATAAINIVGTALAGSMAIYLPGGSDAGWLSKEAMFVNFTLLDFGQLLGWWGVLVAAGCVASLSLRSARVLPRWMGIFSIVAMLPPMVFAIATGLPGMPGLTMPIWLVVISLGMLRARNGAA